MYKPFGNIGEKLPANIFLSSDFTKCRAYVIYSRPLTHRILEIWHVYMIKKNNVHHILDKKTLHVHVNDNDIM